MVTINTQYIVIICTHVEDNSINRVIISPIIIITQYIIYPLTAASLSRIFTALAILASSLFSLHSRSILAKRVRRSSTLSSEKELVTDVDTEGGAGCIHDANS